MRYFSCKINILISGGKTMIKCHLKTILKDNNMSQKELCDMINTRPSTICDLCNNNIESIKLKLLYDICSILCCEISDILTL